MSSATKEILEAYKELSKTGVRLSQKSFKDEVSGLGKEEIRGYIDLLEKFHDTENTDLLKEAKDILLQEFKKRE